MSERRSVARESSAPTMPCPSWCVTAHGVHLGEENWVHTGEPLLLADGVRAVTVMSVDPGTGITDGPYVLIGGREYSLSEARLLGTALTATAELAATTQPTDAPQDRRGRRRG